MLIEFTHIFAWFFFKSNWNLTQFCFHLRAFPLPADRAADHRDAENTNKKVKLGKMTWLQGIRKTEHGFGCYLIQMKLSGAWEASLSLHRHSRKACNSKAFNHL